MTLGCDICHKIIPLDRHHIQSTCYGGPNIEWNKCRICPNCHRKVHYGIIIIEGWFATTSKRGKSLIYRKKDEESITGFPDPKVWIYEKPTVNHKPIGDQINDVDYRIYIDLQRTSLFFIETIFKN